MAAHVRPHRYPRKVERVGNLVCKAGVDRAVLAAQLAADFQTGYSLPEVSNRVDGLILVRGHSFTHVQTVLIECCKRYKVWSILPT